MLYNIGKAFRGKDVIRTEYRDKKWNFPYVEYSTDDKNKKLPLIIQLHGAGERGNGW